MGGGFGYGTGGGIELAWAPGQSLSHTREASVNVSGQFAHVIGARVSQNILKYSPDQRNAGNGPPSVAILLGEGGGIGIQEELSAPLPYLVWGKSSISNSGTQNQTLMRQATNYTSNNNMINSAQMSQPRNFSSAQSNAISGFLSAFTPNNAAQAQAVSNVITSFSRK